MVFVPNSTYVRNMNTNQIKYGDPSKKSYGSHAWRWDRDVHAQGNAVRCHWRVGESFGPCLHERSSTRSRRPPKRANTTEARTIRERLNFLFGSSHHRPHGIGHLSPVCRVHARSQRHSTLYRGRELWRLGLGRAQFFWNRELARSFGVGSSYCCMSVYIPAKLFANFVQVAGLVAQTCAWHLLKELVNP